MRELLQLDVNIHFRFDGIFSHAGSHAYDVCGPCVQRHWSHASSYRVVSYVCAWPKREEDVPCDARQPPHVLILQITARRRKDAQRTARGS